MRKHAKLAEFTQNWPDLRKICAEFAQTCANLRNCFCKIYANSREIYGPICYGTACSCLNVRRARPRAGASSVIEDVEEAADAAAGRAVATEPTDKFERLIDALYHGFGAGGGAAGPTSADPVERALVYMDAPRRAPLGPTTGPMEEKLPSKLLETKFLRRFRA